MHAIGLNCHCCALKRKCSKLLDLQATDRRITNGFPPESEDQKDDKSQVASGKIPEKKKKRRRKVKDYDWSSKPGKHKKANPKKTNGDPGEKVVKNDPKTNSDKTQQATIHSFLRSSSNTNSNNATQLNKDSNPHFMRQSTRTNTFVQSRLSLARNKRGLKLTLNAEAKKRKRDVAGDKADLFSPTRKRRLRNQDSSSKESHSDEEKASPNSPPLTNGTFLGVSPQYQSIKQVESLCKAQVVFAQPWISGLTSDAFDQNSFNFLSKSSKASLSSENQQHSLLFSKYRDLSRNELLDEDDVTSTSEAESSSDDEVTSDDVDSGDDDVTAETSKPNIPVKINLNKITSVWRSAKILSKPLFVENRENKKRFGLGATYGFGSGARSDDGKCTTEVVKRKRGRPRKNQFATKSGETIENRCEKRRKPVEKLKQISDTVESLKTKDSCEIKSDKSIEKCKVKAKVGNGQTREINNIIMNEDLKNKPSFSCASSLLRNADCFYTTEHLTRNNDDCVVNESGSTTPEESVSGAENEVTMLQAHRIKSLSRRNISQTSALREIDEAIGSILPRDEESRLLDDDGFVDATLLDSLPCCNSQERSQVCPGVFAFCVLSLKLRLFRS